MRSFGVRVFLVPPGNWQRVALIIPLILGVTFSAFLSMFWLFFPEKQRQDFLTLNSTFVEWAKVIAGTPPSPPALPPVEDSAELR
jgi:hypothetical protein